MLRFEYSNGDKSDIIYDLKTRKSIFPDFKVIDVGASDNPWTEPVLDAILDYKKSNLLKIEQFQGDINSQEGWEEILNYSQKFSYAVCSHTLEDIAYPIIALRNLPLIAREGVICIPSHMKEMTRGLEYDSKYKGHIHHRWMFRERNNKLLVIPKIPYVEYLKDYNCEPEQEELRIYWKDQIEFEILNNDYLGPNVEYVKKMYEEALC